jgi:hypothetical protein
MRFAILSDHPDGWAVARVLTVSGRHQIYTYCGRRNPSELQADWPTVRVTTDLEELLADPAVEAVIVAGGATERLDQLRRVLQSERPALCVHPVDFKPDGAYEINMLQGDTHQVVVPILPLLVNRSVTEFGETLRARGGSQLIELEYYGRGDVVFSGEDDAGPHFPGWDILRRVGGTIAEVQAFAREEKVHRGEPVTIQGRFESGTLFRAVYLPGQREDGIRLAAIGADGQTHGELVVVGPDDWSRLIERFESAVERMRVTPRAPPGSGPAADGADGPTWLDEIRAAELDDAARRSIERRRSVTLDYQEASEDVGFKGAMTLVGCALIWLVPVFLVISLWLPYVGWLIVPVLFGFLLLQLLRWFVPMPPASGK